MNIRDLPVYKKHYDANEPEEHTKVSIEYAIEMLQELSIELEIDGLRRSKLYAEQKINELKAQLI